MSRRINMFYIETTSANKTFQFQFMHTIHGYIILSKSHTIKFFRVENTRMPSSSQPGSKNCSLSLVWRNMSGMTRECRLTGAGKLVSFLERHALMLRFIDISSARPGALEAL